MSSWTPSVGNDIFAEHGRRIIAGSLKERDGVPKGGPLPPNLPIFRMPVSRGSREDAKVANEPVGILGAGAAGLYTALILDDLGIPFKIIESRDRVGGRLFTHYFSDKPYDYFDVGAMRFPQIDTMSRVFHLFNYGPLNRDGLNLKAKLKPFYFVGASNNNAFFSYNNVTVLQNALPANDPFHSDLTINDTTDASAYIAAGAKAIMDDVIGPFASALLDDLKNGTSTGWDKLMKYDSHSTRSYMTMVYRPSPSLGLPNQALPAEVVNWVETMDKSTGWYDRALSETVLEAVAFGWQPSTEPMEQVEWLCIDGGAFRIAETMYQYLKKRQTGADVFSFGERVTGIKSTKNNAGEKVMTVTTDFTRDHTFSRVITTIPLPVLRTIDMSEAGLSPMQASALRTLDYGPSVKIGMQFKTAWWTHGVNRDGRRLNIVGGQTYTDSPLRTVVYPSFGGAKAGMTTTLIASYCWTEDAERLTPLITANSPVLKEMVLRELSKIHNVTVDFLNGELLDTFAWSWSQDVNTMGAFAFFGPGKFAGVYKSLTTPTDDGGLHFAGEAISVRHAWVAGALDSAWRAVHNLLLEPAYASHLDTFLDHWGLNAEWIREKAVEQVGASPQKYLEHSLLVPHVLKK